MAANIQGGVLFQEWNFFLLILRSPKILFQKMFDFLYYFTIYAQPTIFRLAYLYAMLNNLTES